MPLQNKVDPFGKIHAISMRGLFMGNRGGRIHDPATKTLSPGRTHASRQWITCLTAFKDRKRELMGPGTYTELFFLDEVVALAAGHRPCAECRRADWKRYCAAFSADGAPVKATDLDRQLHDERMGKCSEIPANQLPQLPDGAMFAVGPEAFAKHGKYALPFSFSGYGSKRLLAGFASENAVPLTPASSVTVLRNGYIPVWHPTADT